MKPDRGKPIDTRSHLPRAGGRWDLLILGILILIGTTSLVGWMLMDHSLPSGDPLIHLIGSLHQNQILESDARTELRWLDFWFSDEGVNWYPNLVYQFTTLIYQLADQDRLVVARLSLIPFWILLGLATFDLGRRLADSRAGLLAALFTLAAPLVNDLTRLYYLDLPLAAMVVMALDLLVAGDFFSRRALSIILGLVCGLGMLVKVTFIVFLAGPGLMAWWHGVGKSGMPARLKIPLWATPLFIILIPAFGAEPLHGLAKAFPGWFLNLWTLYILLAAALIWYLEALLIGAGRGIKTWANGCFSLLAALLVAGPWYMRHLNHLVGRGTQMGLYPALERNPPVFSIDGLTYYLWTAADTLLLVPGILLCASGLLYCLVHGGYRARMSPLLICLASAWIVFTAIGDKEPRYLLPLVPLLFILAAGWLGSLGRWRIPVVAVLLLWALVNWLGWTVEVLAPGPWKIHNTYLPGLHVPPRIRANLTAYVPAGQEGSGRLPLWTIGRLPASASWPLETLVETIAGNARHGPDILAGLWTDPAHNFITSDTFRYTALRLGVPLVVARLGDGSPGSFRPQECSYYLLVSSDQEAFDRLVDEISLVLGGIRPVRGGDFSLPDQGTIQVFLNPQDPGKTRGAQ